MVFTNQSERLELDVRMELKNGQDPFDKIMDSVKQLQEHQTFILHTTFKPYPLISLMEMKGYGGHSKEVTTEHWITTFVHKNRQHPDQYEASSSLPSEADLIRSSEQNPCGAVARIIQFLQRANPGDSCSFPVNQISDSLQEQLESLGVECRIEQKTNQPSYLTVKKLAVPER
ncbi:DUF2249 domain-containing protein [Melghirimyces algeriensis]|uniref:Uncharacterized conserved protein n=1 Tax=Melghirimyces algeriensis TaxID=910412 RepID=A0A521CNF0_9BACL|nr:DUF2249 domain-containing protein [Melghirimyces algeriensis]SMO60977.1 Uncharacterized conserved protein [Melghirimyces algeriensis]